MRQKSDAMSLMRQKCQMRQKSLRFQKFLQRNFTEENFSIYYIFLLLLYYKENNDIMTQISQIHW